MMNSNELNPRIVELDQEWQKERTKLLIEGQNGRRYEPRFQIAWLSSILGTLVGSAVLVLGWVMGQLLFAGLSIPLILGANAYAVFAFQRAKRYGAALERYHRRRKELDLNR